MQLQLESYTAAALERALFTADERSPLRQFYADARARQLRERCGLDPWEVLRRRRSFLVSQYQSPAAKLYLVEGAA